MKAVIDNIVNSLSGHPANTGLIVGVIDRDHHSVFGYGKANDASAEIPSGGTLFEIGSITKVFTSSLLSALVADGLLKLDEPVRDLMPSLYNFPAEINLLRLATHTAGLPKMPSNLIRSTFRDRHNPYAAYTTADLFKYLSRYKPERHRGSMDKINYSNLGFALLGHILTQACESSYEEAVISRICDELSLDDTRITLTPELNERSSTPHSANGRQNKNWDMPAFAGAGALHSTADDLLKFLGANLGSPQSSLTEAMQLSHEIRSEAFPQQGRLQGFISGLIQRGQDTQDHCHGVALGWFVGQLSLEGNQVYWHHGATGGYRSFTGFVKTTGTGVVVLANRGPGRLDLLTSKTSADEIGFSVLEYLNSVDQ
ncbi:MAG: serine hydrolase [Anaerolineales bacterium]|nr:serine hydrolase [Anaerolineales bacterium]